MNRGARRLPVFGDDADRRAYLERWSEVTGDDVRVHAYALMDNHYHVLLEADPAKMGAAMKHVAGHYTRRFNTKYGFDGPLFRGRYRSKPITDERQLTTTVRYIHRNPLQAKPLRGDMTWTSHPAYHGVVPTPSWLTTSTILAGFSGDRARFDAFVLDDEVEPSVIIAPVGPGGVRLLTPNVVERALGVASPAERDLLRVGGRGLRNDLRLAALLLASSHTSSNLRDLSARYGYRDAAVTRAAVARARRRRDRDDDFRRLVDDAERRLGIVRNGARESTGV